MSPVLAREHAQSDSPLPGSERPTLSGQLIPGDCLVETSRLQDEAL